MSCRRRKPVYTQKNQYSAQYSPDGYRQCRFYCASYNPGGHGKTWKQEKSYRTSYGRLFQA